MIVPWLTFIAIGLITYAGFLKLAARLLRYSVSWKASFLFAGIMRAGDACYYQRKTKRDVFDFHRRWMVLFSSVNIFNLELHAHIRLKDLVLVERIDWDIA